MVTDEAALMLVNGLVKTFPAGGGKRVHAASDVSLSIAHGQTVGLIGESGSGKTTVGRCLAGLLSIDAGEIYFKGQRIDHLSLRRFRSFRRHIQIVFQEPFEALDPRYSIGNSIEEPLRVHTDMSRESRKQRVGQLLERVGLTASDAPHRPQSLSAGAQQRAGIARALATRPDFLVLDEPTSSLPPDVTPGILALLREIQSEMGVGYLFISHDLSLIRNFCDRVAVMYLGQIVEEGPVEQVLSKPEHPYSRGLLAAVLLPDPQSPRLTVSLPERLSGEIPSPIDLPKGCYLETRCPFATEGCDEPQRLVDLERRPGLRVRCWRSEADNLPSGDPKMEKSGLEQVPRKLVQKQSEANQS